MNEKLMQDIIIGCPAETLDEAGLSYVTREVTTGGRRIDIVLKDRMDRYVLVEAQIGHLDTKHIDRHIDFCEGFQLKNPSAAIRILYIANMINPYQKEFLHRRGYEFKEISQHRLSEIAEKNGILQKPESGVPFIKTQNGGEMNRDHNKGHKWDHNQPDNQDGFLNSLIKRGKSVDEIINEFKNAYPKHANHRTRVQRHINHLVKEHDDFPYKVKDGRFVKKD